MQVCLFLRVYLHVSHTFKDGLRLKNCILITLISLFTLACAFENSKVELLGELKKKFLHDWFLSSYTLWF